MSAPTRIWLDDEALRCHDFRSTPPKCPAPHYTPYYHIPDANKNNLKRLIERWNEEFNKGGTWEAPTMATYDFLLTLSDTLEGEDA